MNPAHLKELCTDFAIGEPMKIEESHEGVLNKNYILITDKGKYFIKSIREKRRTHIPYIAEVEEFMNSKGIPAVRMMLSVQNAKFVEYEGDTYTAYPFLESIRTHKYDISDFETMGVMLGRIHRAGSRDVPASLSRKSWDEKPNQIVQQKIEDYLQTIERKLQQNETDILFLEYIQLKLSMMKSVEDVAILPKTTLVHGDYHARNLLINANRQIIGVCDWEQSDMNARSYELARSVLYVCFNGESDRGPHIYEQNFAIESARAFIDGYNSVYPLSNEEMFAGFKLRLKKLIYSFWIEEQYYSHSDSRSNKFIPHEMRLIRDFSSQNLLDELKVS